ncbi:MAG: hypothetical protein KF752_07090 [Pirellulaceae bacterium]|nr:hypothetical protein [Pirellulaceae bacterium]
MKSKLAGPSSSITYRLPIANQCGYGARTEEKLTIEAEQQICSYRRQAVVELGFQRLLTEV